MLNCDMQQHWYLRMGEGEEWNIERLLFDPDNRPVVGLLDFLTLFILYSSLIPISLYVSIEIIKFFQVCCLVKCTFESGRWTKLQGRGTRGCI